MGLLSEVQSAVNKSTDAERFRIQERLEVLGRLAATRLEVFQAELKETKADLQARGLIIADDNEVAFSSRIHVGTSENLNHAFTRAIDNFFSAATDDSDEKRKGDLKNGFQSLLQGVLDSVLGSGSGAETLGESHFFVAEHNVIVRCDVKIWHYKLNAKSIKEDCDVAGAYLLTKNVLNTKKVPVETIIYTMSEICKDDLDSVKALLERIKEVAKIIGDFDHQEFALAANRYYASLRAPSEVTSSSRYA